MALKNNIIYLISIPVLLLLAAFFLFKDSQSTSQTSSSRNNKNLDINNQVVTTNLAIDAKKCIGCGHCVRTAPANFQMDNNIRKAIVISSADSSSAPVRQAINNCPVAAISLN